MLQEKAFTIEAFEQFARSKFEILALQSFIAKPPKTGSTALVGFAEFELHFFDNLHGMGGLQAFGERVIHPPNGDVQVFINDIFGEVCIL